MKFYLEMPHLPSVPENLIKWPLTNKVEYQSHERQYKKADQPIQNSTFNLYPILPNNKELHEWIVENVYPGCASFNRLTIFENGDSSINGPHTDTARVLILNYFFDLGGDNVWTTWYRTKEDTLLLGESQYHLNYDELTPLETVKFEKNKWYLLNGRVSHSIDGITGSRKYLSLSYLKQDLHLLDDEVLNWFITNSEITSIETDVK